MEKTPLAYSKRDVFTLLAGTFFLFLFLEGVLPARDGKWRLLVLEASLAVPLILLMILGRGRGWSMLRWHRVNARAMGGAALVGLGLSPLFDEVNRLFQMLVPMNAAIRTALSDMLRAEGPLEWILIIGAAVLVAGLAEETLFRGFVQSVFEEEGDISKAVLLTAFLFAVLHFNPWWFMEILVLGVLLGVLAWKTDSIFPGALAHGLYNGWAVCMTNRAPVKGYEMNGHVAPQWLILGFLAVAAGMFLVQKQRKIEDNEDKVFISEEHE